MKIRNAKPKKQQIVINGVPNSLLEKIDQIAKAEDRSRASVVRQLLSKIVDDRLNQQIPKAA